LVSPHTDPVLIEAVRKTHLVSIPGALTPTEILLARAAGADFVKIFPVSAVGGARYLRLLRAPVGGVPFWVSGTVAIEDIEEMFEAGASLIGLTSALFSDLPEALGEAAANRRGENEACARSRRACEGGAAAVGRSQGRAARGSIA